MKNKSHQNKCLVAFCGTRGVPANYGGFETAVDEISSRFVQQGYTVDVFCRLSHSGETLDEYEGRRLITVKGATIRSLETFVSAFQTGWYLLRHRREYSHAFWFNNANFPGILLTLLAGIPVTVNSDGLEWRRKKWRWPFKLYYLFTSFLIARICPTLISDSRAIQKFYREKFWRQTLFIPYGIPSPVESTREEQDKILREYELLKGKYFLQITRLEPDNLPLEAAQGFIKSQLNNIGFDFLIVGYRDQTPYALELKNLSDKNGVRVFPAVYDPHVLYTLRTNCYAYVHGNSVGGTNPALLEAMATCPRILAINSEFSLELLGDLGFLFDPTKIDEAFRNAPGIEDIRSQLSTRANANYDWDAVSKAYMAIIEGTAPEDNPFDTSF